MRVAVITNTKAGTTPDPSPEQIRSALDAAGVSCALCPAEGHDLSAATHQAMQSKPQAVVAAGGDGTISAVASALAGSDIPLGVLPTGTLNHFAKDLGIPLQLQEAAQVIGAGNVRSIDIASVNGQIFINNSSIGIYPHIVQKRDEIRERLGRGKWSAMLMALLNVFKRYPTVHVRINSPTVAFERNTPFVFVGNNRYEISLNMLGKRLALDGHELCVYFPNRTGRFGLLRLALRAVLGRLDQAKDFDQLSIDQLWIDTDRQSVRVALDGEVTRLKPPLHYQIKPSALNVLAPPANGAAQ